MPRDGYIYMLKISKDCVKVGMTVREFNKRYSDYPMIPILGVAYVKDAIAAEIILRLEMDRKFKRIRDSEQYECEPNLAKHFFVDVLSMIFCRNITNVDTDKFKYFAKKLGLCVNEEIGNAIPLCSIMDYLQIENVTDIYKIMESTDIVKLKGVTYIKPTGFIILLSRYNVGVFREYLEYIPLTDTNGYTDCDLQNSHNMDNHNKKNKKNKNVQAVQNVNNKNQVVKNTHEKNTNHTVNPTSNNGDEKSKGIATPNSDAETNNEMREEIMLDVVTMTSTEAGVLSSEDNSSSILLDFSFNF